MSQTKPSRVFWLLVLPFASLGNILAVWFAPRLLAWWFEPPAYVGISCKEATNWAMHNFQNAQLCGVIGGAVVGVAFFFLWYRRRGRSNAPIVPRM